MSKRAKKWARSAREKLKAALGSKCTVCHATTDLEFDCREPRGHAHHGGSTDQRMLFYRREARRGNLQLLCSKHNALKADMPWHEWQQFLLTTKEVRSSTPIIKGCEQDQTLLNPLRDWYKQGRIL
jgi:hypothetical protein